MPTDRSQVSAWSLWSRDRLDDTRRCGARGIGLREGLARLWQLCVHQTSEAGAPESPPSHPDAGAQAFERAWLEDSECGQVQFVGTEQSLQRVQRWFSHNPARRGASEIFMPLAVARLLAEAQIHSGEPRLTSRLILELAVACEGPVEWLRAVQVRWRDPKISRFKDDLFSLVASLSRLGLDVAFECRDAVATYRDEATLRRNLERWLRYIPQPRSGLHRHHHGLYDAGHAVALAPSRNQEFLVGERCVWHVQYWAWLDTQDPNRLTPYELLDAHAPALTLGDLRPGPYGTYRISLKPTAVAPGKAHPFPPRYSRAEDESAPPPPLTVGWWLAQWPADDTGWSAELAVLPLRAPPGNDEPPILYAWFMPEWEGVRRQLSLVRPRHVRCYAVVLAGEARLAAAASAGEPVDAQVHCPLVCYGDREVYDAIFGRVARPAEPEALALVRACPAPHDDSCRCAAHRLSPDAIDATYLGRHADDATLWAWLQWRLSLGPRCPVSEAHRRLAASLTPPLAQVVLAAAGAERPVPIGSMQLGRAALDQSFYLPTLRKNDRLDPHDISVSEEEPREGVVVLAHAPARGRICYFIDTQDPQHRITMLNPSEATETLSHRELVDHVRQWLLDGPRSI